MNINDKYIVELAKASIFDTAPSEPPADVDWNYIFKKSREQSIAGLLCYAVMKLEKSQQPDDGLMAEWNKLMLSTVGLMTQRYNEFQYMTSVIHEKGIQMVGSKGCMIRNLYPVPELRTMGDFDVFVKKEDVDAALQIFVDRGYQIFNEVFCSTCTRKNVAWEIFWGMEEEFRYIPEKMNCVLQNSYRTDAVISPLEPTYFLAHLIVHTGKHYISRGAGIRNLCDIALFISKYKAEIDFQEVKRICAAEKFERVFAYLINAVGVWFGVDISGIDVEETNTEKFLTYSLAYGIFGKDGNSLVGQIAKHEDDKIGGFRKLFFPSVKLLDYRYTYLKKYPFMLPVAWVHRFFSGVFHWKYSVRRMTGEVKEALEFSKERQTWLKELGLFERDE